MRGCNKKNREFIGHNFHGSENPLVRIKDIPENDVIVYRIATVKMVRTAVE